ncbi:MAG: hypothetical protein JO250_19485 [Armatimonadetes bacterium]|nr:hypothetical protein [Armatimonadota bacterium]
MDITERYTTRAGKQYLIRLTYNERIGEADPATAFVRNIEVLDAETRQPVIVPANAARFSTYEDYTSFGSYSAINYFGVRETAIEGLRTKVLTRIEDYLERLG